MLVSQLILICDRCQDDGPYGWYAARVRQEALKEGWKRQSWQDICPTCVGEVFE